MKRVLFLSALFYAGLMLKLLFIFKFGVILMCQLSGVFTYDIIGLDSICQLCSSFIIAIIKMILHATFVKIKKVIF